MSSLDIAPYPEGAPAFGRDRCRIRRRLRVSFRRAGSCTFWRLGFRQFSFHRIARVPWRTVPDTWTRPPVSCHALFPLTFRRQVRHRTHGHPSNPSRLRRGYNEAPRGALRICRVWCLLMHAVERRWRRVQGEVASGQSGDCLLRLRAGASAWSKSCAHAASEGSGQGAEHPQPAPGADVPVPAHDRALVFGGEGQCARSASLS
jgi:hypothetical protein